MRKLTDKQRAFVIQYLEYPVSSGASAVRRAGYSTAGASGAGSKVEARRLLQKPRVLAAIREELDARFKSDAVVARRALLDIVNDKAHPHRLKAATALLDRGGFHSMHEQKISVEHRDMTAEGMIERITALAGELNLDPRKLLGHNSPVTIDAEVIEPESVAEDTKRPTDAPAARVVRYVARSMVREFVRVGWAAPKTDPGTDLVEVVWTGDNPIEPDTRPLMRPDLFGRPVP
jgi:phage terminase small subunit